LSPLFQVDCEQNTLTTPRERIPPPLCRDLLYAYPQRNNTQCASPLCRDLLHACPQRSKRAVRISPPLCRDLLHACPQRNNNQCAYPIPSVGTCFMHVRLASFGTLVKQTRCKRRDLLHACPQRGRGGVFDQPTPYWGL
jgi:hypothetical protein